MLQSINLQDVLQVNRKHQSTLMQTPHLPLRNSALQINQLFRPLSQDRKDQSNLSMFLNDCRTQQIVCLIKILRIQVILNQ